ncbi:MAG: hypothetical protein QOI66_4901 [Myxococcales bacterium]|jgi:hypothetical protein|nr:hypothetical protein [Myxococcales bacterium]
MKRWNGGRMALLAGAFTMMTGAAACSSSPPGSSDVDAAPAPRDVAAEAAADVVDAVAEVAEVSLFGTTCLMPNPASSGLPNPALYDTGITGTVFDRMTGLMWQRSASGSTFTQAAAGAACKGSKLGGYADWRLPTVIELVSIVDFTATSPSVDSATFSGTSSNLYWTSTPLAAHPTNAWYVSFAQGATSFVDASVSNLARCVRTAMNMAAGCYAEGARFKADAGMVTDASTGLVWQQTVPMTAVTWSAAKASCDALGAGFRLPSLKELQTIVDYGKVYPGPGPAIDPVAFPATPIGGYWTSSSVSGSTSAVWMVRFDNGDTASNGIVAATDLRYVRCVH